MQFKYCTNYCWTKLIASWDMSQGWVRVEKAANSKSRVLFLNAIIYMTHDTPIYAEYNLKFTIMLVWFRVFIHFVTMHEVIIRLKHVQPYHGGWVRRYHRWWGRDGWKWCTWMQWYWCACLKSVEGVQLKGGRGLAAGPDQWLQMAGIESRIELKGIANQLKNGEYKKFCYENASFNSFENVKNGSTANY